MPRMLKRIIYWDNENISIESIPEYQMSAFIKHMGNKSTYIINLYHSFKGSGSVKNSRRLGKYNVNYEPHNRSGRSQVADLNLISQLSGDAAVSDKQMVEFWIVSKDKDFCDVILNLASNNYRMGVCYFGTLNLSFCNSKISYYDFHAGFEKSADQVEWMGKFGKLDDKKDSLETVPLGINDETYESWEDRDEADDEGQPASIEKNKGKVESRNDMLGEDGVCETPKEASKKEDEALKGMNEVTQIDAPRENKITIFDEIKKSGKMQRLEKYGKISVPKSLTMKEKLVGDGSDLSVVPEDEMPKSFIGNLSIRPVNETVIERAHRIKKMLGLHVDYPIHTDLLMLRKFCKIMDDEIRERPSVKRIDKWFQVQYKFGKMIPVYCKLRAPMSDQTVFSNERIEELEKLEPNNHMFIWINKIIMQSSNPWWGEQQYFDDVGCAFSNLFKARAVLSCLEHEKNFYDGLPKTPDDLNLNKAMSSLLSSNYNKLRKWIATTAKSDSIPELSILNQLIEPLIFKKPILYEGLAIRIRYNFLVISLLYTKGFEIYQIIDMCEKKRNCIKSWVLGSINYTQLLKLKTMECCQTASFDD